MNHSLQKFTYALAVVLGCTLVSSATAQDDVAAEEHQTPLAANLFYNYYTQGAMNQVNAQMYLAPRPVPAYVGHSYYTYQPLMPHEHMYRHGRNYYNWQPGAYYENPCRGQCGGTCGECQGAGSGALNKTTVRYSSGWNHIGPMVSSLHPFERIHSSIAKRRYCTRDQGRARGRQQAGGCATGNCGTAARPVFSSNK